MRLQSLVISRHPIPRHLPRSHEDHDYSMIVALTIVHQDKPRTKSDPIDEFSSENDNGITRDLNLLLESGNTIT